MRHAATPRVQGALVGLAVVALAALFFFVLAPLLPKTVDAAEARNDLLRAWASERVKAELGEYDERVPDCGGMAQGLTGYVWVDEGHARILILCEP